MTAPFGREARLRALRTRLISLVTSILNSDRRRATISAAWIRRCSIVAMSGAALHLTPHRGDARRPSDAARAKSVVKRT
jgi:hypothetical protein